MLAAEFAAKLGAKVLTGEPRDNTEIKGIYCGDLLSWVMSHAPKSSAWVTVHTHLNIVAVASISELSCIIIPEGIKVDEATINRAIDENTIIISSELTAYEICSIAHDCGI
ncbi:MAG: AraC family transcriptional regulator [Clostridiaceae bacterium]|jgi:hypothetical protein|nr:AraC family transcriptional regulator [Clostridiaceae bacterium]